MPDERGRVTGRKALPFRLASLLLGVFLFSVVLQPALALARPVAASIMVDAATGEVISSSNADVPTYPASLTKMMTLYLLFDALKHGQIKLSDSIVFSEHAASQDATNLAVSAGDSIRVETAILAIVVRSANDAATAVGERLGGNEWTFAQKMTQQARALGMSNTVFRNANGLPNPDQHTTARDMAILGVALLRDFPEYYHYFASESFTYQGVQYAGHNHILDKFDGADGIKTGYIRASGFNLVSSAERNGRRLVGVIMGGETPYVRDRNMVAMLNKGFATKAGSGTTMLALGAAKPAVTPAAAPAQIAAIAPAVTTAAIAPIAASQGFVAKPMEGFTTAASAATPASAPGDPLLPLLKPGSGLELADNDQPDPQAIDNVWRSGTATYGVQIGAYSQYAPAQSAAVRITRSMPSLFADARVVIDESNSLYRARVMGLSKADAEKACQTLKAQQSDCMVLYTNDGLAKAN